MGSHADEMVAVSDRSSVYPRNISELFAHLSEEPSKEIQARRASECLFGKFNDCFQG